ncbi:hypothetical protein BDD12DRAFT_871597 [Trichophaea hybrida]|nr:hypothetical protein BDD12DRAFT_871597 [Trichophaea hybrida]
MTDPNSSKEMTINHAEDVLGENGAMILDTEDAGDKGAVTGLKLAKDGQTVLQPQPINDPNDPLNWSSFKKRVCAYVPLALTVPLTGTDDYVHWQGMEYASNLVNHSGNLNIIFLYGSLRFPVTSLISGESVDSFGLPSSILGESASAALDHSFRRSVHPRVHVHSGFHNILRPASNDGIRSNHLSNYWFKFHKGYVFLPRASVLQHKIPDYTKHLPRMLEKLGFGLPFSFPPPTAVRYSENSSLRAPENGVVYSGSSSPMMRVLRIWQIQNHNGNLLSVSRSVSRLIETLFKPVVIPTVLYYIMPFMWAVGINITTFILFETPKEMGGYGFSSMAVGIPILHVRGVGGYDRISLD